MCNSNTKETQIKKKKKMQVQMSQESYLTPLLDDW